jgi:diguanylate cyclase (GGDEF)-like protein
VVRVAIRTGLSTAAPARHERARLALSQFTLTRSKLAKIGLVAAAGLIVLAGGLFAAGAMRQDAALEERYVRALDLAARSLEAQRAAARVYERVARVAVHSSAGPPRTGKLDEELRRLSENLDELGAQLAALREVEATELSNRELAQAREAVARLAALAGKMKLAAADPAALRGDVVGLAEPEFRQIDDALRALLAVRRAQIDDTAHELRRTDRVARISVFAAGVLALALGLLLTLVAWRSLSANALLMEQLSQLAREDGLTGVANRRTLDERLPQEMARATRQKYKLSVVMIDLDHFKRFNDRRGHAAGDALLRNAAQAWLRQLRPTDLLARYGGEEFTLVLPACDESQAEHMVERLQPLMPERQTFSAGIATWNGIDSANELLAAADRALLQAKRGGRNRIVISGREPQISLPLKLAS